MAARTQSYKFTVKSLDDERLAQLREFVRLTNKLREPGAYRRRVSVRARLGRDNPHRSVYSGRYHYAVAREHAAHFDVYVHNDYNS